MQSKPIHFEDKMSRRGDLIIAVLLVDYNGNEKNQIIFLEPREFETLKAKGIVAEQGGK